MCSWKRTSSKHQSLFDTVSVIRLVQWCAVSELYLQGRGAL
jgi:hypothetical protein